MLDIFLVNSSEEKMVHLITCRSNEIDIQGHIAVKQRTKASLEGELRNFSFNLITHKIR